MSRATHFAGTAGLLNTRTRQVRGRHFRVGPIVRSLLNSLRLDAGGLDPRPPLLDLGLVEGGERTRRLLLAREKLVSETGESRTHRRIGEASFDVNDVTSSSPFRNFHADTPPVRAR